MGTLGYVGVSVAMLATLFLLVKTFILLHSQFGFFLAILAIIPFPITFLVAPWYAPLALGDWTMVVLGQGGILTGYFFFWLGDQFEKPRHGAG